MRSFGVLLAAFVFACVAGVLGQTPVESYIAKESPIAKAGLLANIGPDGSKSSGAKVGRRRYLSSFVFPLLERFTR